MLSTTEAVHALALSLPRHEWNVLSSLLPRSGIYFFFERGESVPWNGGTADRIVRVGTHNRDERFRSRIRQHYGPLSGPGGNHSGSIFRKHLGAALLNRDDPSDARIELWLKEQGKFPDIEIEVSRVLRQNFTFSCFQVETMEERHALESGLVALLAQYPISSPSPDWLGHYSVKAQIRSSGLWNVLLIDKTPLTAAQLDCLAHLITPPARDKPT
jgi:hypothetical protein